jgi:Fur family ferric uptake transcriptional regulator
MEADEAVILQKLALREIKPTAMRILILGKMLSTPQAMSLQDLEDALESADKSTIFRNLNLFRTHKLIHEIDDGSGSLKYSVCSDSCHCVPDDEHVHFFCEVCHRTFCLKSIAVPAVTLPSGFEVESINYVLKGTCQECTHKKRHKE